MREVGRHPQGKCHLLLIKPYQSRHIKKLVRRVGRRPYGNSHFHLDRTRKTLGLHNRTTIRDLQRIIGPAPREKEVAVSGCIAVFCDPDRYGYPSSVEIDYLQKNGISVAIGMHPKSRLLYQDQWTDFCRALSTPGVVALGEIGLDFTLPNRSTQEDRLENMLGHITGPFRLWLCIAEGRGKIMPRLL